MSALEIGEWSLNYLWSVCYFWHFIHWKLGWAPHNLFIVRPNSYCGRFRRHSCPWPPRMVGLSKMISVSGRNSVNWLCWEDIQTASLCRSGAFMLALSSPVMPFGIILLILFFICYNFLGPQKIASFFVGQKDYSIWRAELKVWCHMPSLGWKGLRPARPRHTTEDKNCDICHH
jgi:hypothetical protein